MIITYDLHCALPAIEEVTTVSALLILASDATDMQRQEIMDDLEFVPSQNKYQPSVLRKKIYELLDFIDDGIKWKEQQFYVGTILNFHHMRAKLLLASRHENLVVRLLQLTGVNQCKVINTTYKAMVRYNTILSATYDFDKVLSDCKFCSTRVSEIASRIESEATVDLLCGEISSEADIVRDTISYYIYMLDIREDRDDVQSWFN